MAQVFYGLDHWEMARLFHDRESLLAKFDIAIEMLPSTGGFRKALGEKLEDFFDFGIRADITQQSFQVSCEGDQGIYRIEDLPQNEIAFWGLLILENADLTKGKQACEGNIDFEVENLGHLHKWAFEHEELYGGSRLVEAYEMVHQRIFGQEPPDLVQ